MGGARAAIVACALLGLACPAQADEPAEAPAQSSAPPAPASDPEFAAAARVRPQHVRANTLSAAELNSLRDSLGDSFNAVESMPAVIPVFSGVPYMLVRGAPPAGTGQYYDGVPVPSLFHFALGPVITHPSLIGELKLYPGVAPARYGRRIGATFVAEGPRGPAQNGGEAELRLLDAQALLTRKAPALTLYARLGYPQLMLDAVDSGAVLSYWDYQARYETALGEHDTLTLFALGAADRGGEVAHPEDDIALQFHRWLARITRSLPNFELGSALYLGYERGVLGQELSARSGRIGPSLWLEWKRADGTRLRAGADMEARLSRLHRTPVNEQGGSAMPPFQQPGTDFLPDLTGGTTLDSGPADFVDRAPLARVGERNAVGSYLELGLAPLRSLDIETGVRADAWFTAGEVEQSTDPRLLVRWRATPEVALHVGAGTAHEAASSPLPVPGLADVALDHGLQRAVQTEAGVEFELPSHAALSATGFYHRYSHLVFMELILDCEGNSDPYAPFVRGGANATSIPLCRQQGLPRGDGDAYGIELLLKRSLLERLNGWVDYTLAYANATASDGTEFVPQFDVRHLVNMVLSYDWGGGFQSGLRLHFRSGKPAVNTIYDFTQQRLERVERRLPSFVRLDLNLGYGFRTSWGRMWLSLQWLNVTFSREATKRDCRVSSTLAIACDVDYTPAIVLPNAGVRAEF